MLVTAWLIRHGESAGNAGLPTQSPASTPLTERGHEQATELQLPRPSLIVVSRFIRTRQTAEPTINRYPDVPIEVWPVEEYTFLNSAKYVNTTQDERLPFANAYIERNDPNYNDGGDAESFYDVLNRAAETLDRLKQNQGTAVFSHARFIQALRWVHEGRRGTPKEFFAWAAEQPVPNASVTTLFYRLVPRGWVLDDPAVRS